jgi:hypothetical protein
MGDHEVNVAVTVEVGDAEPVWVTSDVRNLVRRTELTRA